MGPGKKAHVRIAYILVFLALIGLITGWELSHPTGAAFSDRCVEPEECSFTPECAPPNSCLTDKGCTQLCLQEIPRTVEEASTALIKLSDGTVTLTKETGDFAVKSLDGRVILRWQAQPTTITVVLYATAQQEAQIRLSAADNDKNPLGDEILTARRGRPSQGDMTMGLNDVLVIEGLSGYGSVAIKT